MREQGSEHSGKKMMDRKQQTELQLDQDKRGKNNFYMWRKGGQQRQKKDRYGVRSSVFVFFRIFHS